LDTSWSRGKIWRAPEQATKKTVHENSPDGCCVASVAVSIAQKNGPQASACGPKDLQMSIDAPSLNNAPMD
jgi:hypothetical protein